MLHKQSSKLCQSQLSCLSIIIQNKLLPKTQDEDAHLGIVDEICRSTDILQRKTSVIVYINKILHVKFNIHINKNDLLEATL